jgi:RNA polymerase sigma-70 factor (ECF subfamily)
MPDCNLIFIHGEVGLTMITDRQFTDIWTEAQRGLRSYALVLCRNPPLAEDLVQQTALQAWEGRHRLRSNSNVRSWLFVILRNYHYSLLRRKKCEVEDPEGALSASVAVYGNYFAERDLADVTVALRELPEKQRRALSHVALRGLSYAETARLCSCKEGTVKSRVARARQQLLETINGRTLGSPARASNRMVPAHRSRSPVSAV